MIKVTKIVNVTENTDGSRTMQVDLLADHSSEVVENGTQGANIIGLGAHDKLDFGSTCFTTESEFGILNSSGVWIF